MHYSIETGTGKSRKYVKGYGFLSFAWNLSNKCRKQLLDTTTKAGINVSKKVIYHAAEAIGEFSGSKISDVVAKSYDDKTV